MPFPSSLETAGIPEVRAMRSHGPGRHVDHAQAESRQVELFARGVVGTVDPGELGLQEPASDG